ncbi:hypothetical protein NQ315_016596 [Exocentrus adspersus]|uniref:CCHC-type domain-containing protein n=1 Tax=Exocentrus adspersus TaxID=1586481 RepID=A0AAV8V9W4_9CUCU|nr:hypothetical protein NQ315_016596 [Exocentrus adspersus]
MVNLAYPTAPAEVIGQLSVSKLVTAKQAFRSTSKVKIYQYHDRKRKMQKPSKNLVDSIKDVLEKFSDGQDSEDSTTNRRRPIRCWTCGVEGHVRSRCSQPSAEQNQGNAKKPAFEGEGW